MAEATNEFTMANATDDLRALKNRYDGPTIQDALNRLTVAQGSEDMETWARNLYTAKALGDDNAVSLNKDRKTILELAYDLVRLWNKVRDQFGEEAATNFEDEIAGIFKLHNIERILGFGLPMDRAQALYAMKIPATNLYGMHWYCDYHFDNSAPYCKYDYSQEMTDEEREEWQTLLHTYPGFPTMNKKLYQLLFCEKFGFQRRHPSTFGLWSKPHEAAFVDIGLLTAIRDGNDDLASFVGMSLDTFFHETLNEMELSIPEGGQAPPLNLGEEEEEGNEDGQIRGSDIPKGDDTTKVILGLTPRKNGRTYDGLPRGNDIYQEVMQDYIWKTPANVAFGIGHVEEFLRDQRLNDMTYYSLAGGGKIKGGNWKLARFEPLTLEHDLQKLKEKIRSPLNTARKKLLKSIMDGTYNANTAVYAQNQL